MVVALGPALPAWNFDHRPLLVRASRLSRAASRITRDVRRWKPWRRFGRDSFCLAYINEKRLANLRTISVCKLASPVFQRHS